ncbi:hypothetical protein DFJ63DRAFT_318586 [Scheffersomyces coipomensis]|uniref:uncharacterized protein n=1 Tax=Scheffersomyces coipomensis TaxID=1788519 RepID=UPI00315C9782
MLLLFLFSSVSKTITKSLSSSPFHPPTHLTSLWMSVRDHSFQSISLATAKMHFVKCFIFISFNLPTNYCHWFICYNF